MPGAPDVENWRQIQTEFLAVSWAFCFFLCFFLFFLFDEMPIETEKINMKSTHREIKRRNLHRGSISFSTAPKPEEIGAVLFI